MTIDGKVENASLQSAVEAHVLTHEVDIASYSNDPNLGNSLQLRLVIKGNNQAERWKRIQEKEIGPIGIVGRSSQPKVPALGSICEITIKQGESIAISLDEIQQEPEWGEIIEPHALTQFKRNSWIAGGGDKVVIRNEGGQKTELTSPWYKNIHDVKVWRGYLVVLSAGIDSFVISKMNNPADILAVWNSDEIIIDKNQIQLIAEGKRSFTVNNSEVTLPDLNVIGVPTADRRFGMSTFSITKNGLLVTCGNSGEIIEVNPFKKGHKTIKDGVKNPHVAEINNGKLSYVSSAEGKWVVADTNTGETTVYDFSRLPGKEELDSKASREWLQYVVSFENLVFAVDVARRRIHILDINERKKKSILYDSNLAIHQIIIAKKEDKIAKEPLVDSPKVISLIKMYPGFGYQGGGAEKSLHSINLANANHPNNIPIDMHTIVLTAPDNITDETREKVSSSTESKLMDTLSSFNDGIHILHLWDDLIFPRNQELGTRIIKNWKGPVVYRVVSSGRIKMIAELMRQQPEVINQINKFVVLSEEMRRDMLELVPESRIAYIPNSIDPNVYFPACSEEEKEVLKNLILQTPDNPIVFLNSGRIFSSKKGVSELLKAWEKSDIWKTGTILLLVGGKREFDNNVSGFDFSRLKELNIKFLPFIQGSQTMAEVYRLANVYVLPSYEEGMSRSLLEALASGIPAIARTGVSGNLQLIGNDAGILFQSFEDLVEDLITLNNDPQLRYQMGENARKKIVSMFSQNKALDLYINLYKGITTDREP